MLVQKNGKQLEVTERAYQLVYGPRGFEPIKQTAIRGDKAPQGEVEVTTPTVGTEAPQALGESQGRLTDEEYAYTFKNKGNVSEKLLALGVEFDKDTSSDDLKVLLESELAARDLLPE